MRRAPVRERGRPRFQLAKEASPVVETPDAGQAPLAAQPSTPQEREMPQEPATAPGADTLPRMGGGEPSPSDEQALVVPARVRVGSVVDGTVVAVDADQLLVDIGGKSDGVVPLAEAVVPPGKALADVFSPGQRLPVTVVGYDAQEGTPRLSQRRAAEAAVWRRLESVFHSGEAIEATVAEAVKGGLVLDLGVRAFMPASHLERGHVADLAPYVGRVLPCRIIELDRARGKAIVSRKSLLEEEARQRKEHLWGALEEGQACQGVVKSLTDFGAFIDLGGVDGLLHVSAMAWGRVDHPSEVLAVGDPVTVKVLKLDRERGKISLGLKQLLPDPWLRALERYPVGSVVEGRVARLASFGAFVQLEPGVDGLVHVSQMADHHVRDPREVVSEGERVRARVIRVVPEEHRISLSLRELDPVQREDASPAHEGADAGGAVTLRDVVGDLFQRAGVPAPGPAGAADESDGGSAAPVSSTDAG